MGDNLIIDYFCKEQLCTHIEIVDGNVNFINYTDDTIDKAFGNQVVVNKSSVYEFLEDRCFPKTRANCKRVLQRLGLDYYDAYLICKKTHGVLWEDFNWIRFDNESVTWEDVKLRD